MSGGRLGPGAKGWPGWNRLDHHELPPPAVRARQPFDPRDAAQETGRRFDDRRLRGRHLEGGAGRRQAGLLAGRRQEPVMADALEAVRQHMQEEAADGRRKRPMNSRPGRRIVRFLPASARTRKATSWAATPTMRSFEMATRWV